MKTYEIPLFDSIGQEIVTASLVEGIPLDQIARANAQWTQMKQAHRKFCRKHGLPLPKDLITMRKPPDLHTLAANI